MTGRDDEREVGLDDDGVILPDQTRDDTDAGWGERYDGGGQADDVARLIEERPPHWS